jgi:beta-phosphoglucomutase-like phosphatase (HAD superfamily)
MTLQGRIKRLEKSFSGKLNMNPDNIKGILAFFQSGDEAKIPAGISLEETQAAARAVAPAGAAELPGLVKLRAALREKCKGDILDHIAGLNSDDKKTRIQVFWGNDPEREKAFKLLGRLGLIMFFKVIYAKEENIQGA